MNAQETSTSHASQNSNTVERLGRLAGAIAHDFNNLLLAVQGHAELITMLPGVKEGGDVQNRAMTIVEASKRGAGKLFIKKSIVSLYNRFVLIVKMHFLYIESHTITKTKILKQVMICSLNFLLFCLLSLPIRTGTAAVSI